jgi:hypothetical protein
MPRDTNNPKVIPLRPANVLAKPPGKLGRVGGKLWRDVVSAYAFDSVASYETLFQACAAADRAQELRERIDKDGVVLTTATGVLKDHPALRHELANRAFVVRSLGRLGLDLEPLNDRPGRPLGR